MYSTIQAREQYEQWRRFDSYMEGRRQGNHYYTDYRPSALRANQSIGGPDICKDNKGKKFIAMQIP